MKRHTPSGKPFGFTLIEVLIATTLSLMIMGVVIAMFSRVTASIGQARAGVEAADRLRLAASRLQQDLGGLTVDMTKVWHRPEDNEGYFEYVEGPMTQSTASTYALNTDNGSVKDSTVGDFDDMLLFTTRSSGRPFIGKVSTSINSSGTIQSNVAEVAWFMRGRTLYRRMLLVAPNLQNISNTISATGFYANYDLSVHASSGNVVLNTLGDLTKRENRFAHNTSTFPFDIRGWAWTYNSYSFPTLPTLRECSSSSWVVGATPGTAGSLTTHDMWSYNTSYRMADTALGSSGTRIADDVILTNVIGFDVRAWDPKIVVKHYDSSGSLLATFNTDDSGYSSAYSKLGTQSDNSKYVLSEPGGYVDLGFAGVSCPSGSADCLGHYGAVGFESTGLVSTASTARIYDTWPTHYESVGTSSSDTYKGRAINGLDDDNNGIVDDANEFLTAPPYPIPLRGIMVRIRTFEPDSRQVREVTVIQDFLSK